MRDILQPHAKGLKSFLCLLQTFEAPYLTTLQLDNLQRMPIQALNLQHLTLNGCFLADQPNIDSLLCQIPTSVTYLNLARDSASSDRRHVDSKAVGSLRRLRQLKDLALVFCVQSSSLLEHFKMFTRWYPKSIICTKVHPSLQMLLEIVFKLSLYTYVFQWRARFRSVCK